MASLAIIDPSTLFRAGLAALARTMGFDPVQEAADLSELVPREADGARPDLVLVGLPERTADIAPLMRDIRTWAPQAKVVFIAATLDPRTLIACFAAGASGYLLDNISRDALKHGLRLVSVGENVFPSELAKVLSTSTLITTGSGDVSRELRDLRVTDREVEVLRGLASGQPNHAIAAMLDISETAVSAEIRHILRKLRLSNRTQAALWAVAKGLAPPLGK